MCVVFFFYQKREKNLQKWLSRKKKKRCSRFSYTFIPLCLPTICKYDLYFCTLKDNILNCLAAKGNSGAVRPSEVHILRFSPLLTGCFFTTVSVGFHFAKIKVENVLIQIWRRKNREKKPITINPEQIRFYKFVEARSTSSLLIKVQCNQWEAKSVELLLQKSL